ncbi:hypothetical protein V6N11_033429 [Hibiscus sabdariffa]|uniref:Uncharacterized protein n=1 Tax=Hibiscus sabdariffa TaxID=183260 RepID=A0ABR2PY24_9ROSI
MGPSMQPPNSFTTPRNVKFELVLFLDLLSCLLCTAISSLAPHPLIEQLLISLYSRPKLALNWSDILDIDPSFASYARHSCPPLLPSALSFPVVILCQSLLAFYLMLLLVGPATTATRTTLHSGNKKFQP